MKYSLRSLMIVVLVVPPLLALVFFAVKSSLSDPFAYRPEVVRVEGVVRLNSTPVSGVTVYFAFDDGNFAIGNTDDDGEFLLGFMGYPGCPPKPARVWIDSSGALSPSLVGIPARYEDSRQSPLTASPQRGKPNYIVLDLSSP
jgi:hypothetical protein